ncbi:MAG: hypothetical protein PHX54_03145 [Lentimicrobiaceae bacterium]|nr:hypothetical protein [Lentimicrobiaceae bacterium]
MCIKQHLTQTKIKTCFFTFLLGIFFAGIALSGCEYEFIEFDDSPILEEVSFKDDVIPIFNSSCGFSGCHVTGAVPPDLTAENAYQSLMKLNMVSANEPANSLLYTSMASGSMKKYSTPDQTRIIRAWIEQGAKNN